ncbi:hypothetical protein [Nocardia sp. CDC160]|uniref:hypothetical protein n=1 Tax=Nocardia sp. CDC160 TaxID=3112166 RepID=UPI002DBC1F68|nr:hypothetical protein [Nocardia sp. CDC160]MEC3919201.1 hypothetical protein [Nocardia sp. CDC160]
MIRKTIVAAAVGALVCTPAMASADPGIDDFVADRSTAQEISINTGSAAADVVINGLITAIFGPDDPSTCKFPYCF